MTSGIVPTSEDVFGMFLAVLTLFEGGQRAYGSVLALPVPAVLRAEHPVADQLLVAYFPLGAA